MYATPADVWISATWQDHRDRNPPSQEPGTDYATAYGTAIRCAGDGVIADLSWSTSGGTGRYITVDLDDGRRVRYLHLAAPWAALGQRVSRGEGIAASGASGWGSDWGYGAHVHVTLFPGHWYDFDGTLDFELWAGEMEEDDMTPEQATTLAQIHQILYTTPEQPGGWNGIAKQLGEVHAATADAKGNALSTPAWIAGFFLGLIGLVEVLRFVVEIVT